MIKLRIYALAKVIREKVMGNLILFIVIVLFFSALVGMGVFFKKLICKAREDRNTFKNNTQKYNFRTRFLISSMFWQGIIFPSKANLLCSKYKLEPEYVRKKIKSNLISLIIFVIGVIVLVVNVDVFVKS